MTHFGILCNKEFVTAKDTQIYIYHCTMWQFAFIDKSSKFSEITLLNISFSYLGSIRKAPKYISQLYHVRFDILTIVNVKIMIFCNVTLCSLIHAYQYFTRMCCPHISHGLTFYSEEGSGSLF
jgi:hypothetical protein